MKLPTTYYYSDREIVPRDIAQKARKEGVVQKDHNGDWRIISFKQSPPEFWDAHYDSKEDAEKALGAYHAQKHYSSYDKVSDEDLEDEIYKRALKKNRRRALLKGALLGGVAGAIGGWLKHRFGFGNPSYATSSSAVGAGIGALTGALGGYSWGKYYQGKEDEMNTKQFQNILKKEYEKAYKNRPHLTSQPSSQDSEDEDDTKLYSEKKKEKPAYINDDEDLRHYKSRKGIVGSIIPGLPGIMGAEKVKDLYTNNLLGLGIVASGPIGRYAGNKKADELDKRGKDDKQILRKSVAHGTSLGALTGAASGTLLGFARKEPSKMAAIGSVLGGIGSGYGTYASVKDRLDTRKKYADRS